MAVNSTLNLEAQALTLSGFLSNPNSVVSVVLYSHSLIICVIELKDVLSKASRFNACRNLQIKMDKQGLDAPEIEQHFCASKQA